MGSAKSQLLHGNFCSVTYKLINKRSQTRQIDGRSRADQTFSCSLNVVILSLNATDLYENMLSRLTFLAGFAAGFAQTLFKVNEV